MVRCHRACQAHGSDAATRLVDIRHQLTLILLCTQLDICAFRIEFGGDPDVVRRVNTYGCARGLRELTEFVWMEP